MGDLSDLSAVSIFLTMPVLHFLKLRVNPPMLRPFSQLDGSGCGALMDLATLLALTFWEWVPKVFVVLSAIKEAFLMFFSHKFSTKIVFQEPTKTVGGI